MEKRKREKIKKGECVSGWGKLLCRYGEFKQFKNRTELHQITAIKASSFIYRYLLIFAQTVLYIPIYVIKS